VRASTLALYVGEADGKGGKREEKGELVAESWNGKFRCEGLPSGAHLRLEGEAMADDGEHGSERIAKPAEGAGSTAADFGQPSLEVQYYGTTRESHYGVSGLAPPTKRKRLCADAKQTTTKWIAKICLAVYGGCKGVLWAHKDKRATAFVSDGTGNTSCVIS
jgi:hypothetical protein